MKKIKNLIFMLFFSFLLVWNTLIVSANNNVRELEEVVVIGKKKEKYKLEVPKPKLPTAKEVGENIKKLAKEKEAKEKEKSNECKGIKLNTDFPFIWRCIGISGGEAGVNQTNAFAFMIKGIMKFIITIIMILSVLIIVAAGVLITTGGYEQSNSKKGIEMIKNVAWALALLGASGVILKLINPNFFV